MARRTRSIRTASAVVALLVAAGAGPAAAIGGADPSQAPPGVPAPGSPPAVPALEGTLGGVAGSQSAPRTQASGNPMTGQFVVSSGKCGSGEIPVGSYFSMLDPSGNPVDNGDSPCGDKAATPLEAGTEGLLPGKMQPFAGSPGATRVIVAPATFFGSPFAVATQGPDKQSGTAVEAPAIRESNGKLSGQVSAFQAFYNGAYYNQGAPKPGGGTPGRTTAGVSGTYDASSGAFVLEWRSTITGGAFNSFTGTWHLEGTYKAGAATTSGGSSPSGSQGAGSGSSGSTSSGTTPSGTTPSGTTSGTPGAGTASGGGSALADTGLGAAGTGSAALGIVALTLALWWRRTGWAS